MALPELIAPISVDLRAEESKLDIIKGLENVSTMAKDEPLAASVVVDIDQGEWMVKSAAGLALPGVVPVANTYPVLTGNTQFDSLATGQLTILIGGGFIYRTTKFVPGSYTVGQNLTVKDLGAGQRVPSAAGAGEPIVGRVYTAPDSEGVMEIEVLDR